MNSIALSTKPNPLGTKRDFEISVNNLNIDMLNRLKKDGTSDGDSVVMTYTLEPLPKYTITLIDDVKLVKSSGESFQIVTVSEFKQYVKGEE